MENMSERCQEKTTSGQHHSQRARYQRQACHVLADVNSAGENDSTFQACSDASILVHSVRHGSRLLNRPRHES